MGVGGIAKFYATSFGHALRVGTGPAPENPAWGVIYIENLEQQGHELVITEAPHDSSMAEFCGDVQQGVLALVQAYVEPLIEAA